METSANAPGQGFQVGAVIDGHRLLELLGTGGFGQVWRVEHEATGARRALKVLLGACGHEERLRFAREAEAMARLDGHPHVLRIHATGVHRGQPYQVCDLAAEDLHSRLQGGPLPAAEARRIARELALGLEHVHRQGFLHRDLKPHNVLLAEDGRAVLTDFGLVRRLAGSSLTRTGAMLGTPAFMAPEQALGEPVTPRTDVYGLGAVLYCMLSARPPHEGSALELLTAVCTRDPEPVSRWTPDVDPTLEAVCVKALQRDPLARYASAAEFGAALDAPPPRPGVRAGLWAALGLTLAGALLALTLPRAAPRPAPAAALPPLDWEALGELLGARASTDASLARGQALLADGAPAQALRAWWSCAALEPDACALVAEHLPPAVVADPAAARRLCFERGAARGSARCELELAALEADPEATLARLLRVLGLPPSAGELAPDPRGEARARLVALCAAHPELPVELDEALRWGQEAFLAPGVDRVALERAWLALAERALEAFFRQLPRPVMPTNVPSDREDTVDAFGVVARGLSQAAREQRDDLQALAWAARAATQGSNPDHQSYTDLAGWLRDQDAELATRLRISGPRYHAIVRALYERAAAHDRVRGLEYLGWAYRSGDARVLIPQRPRRALELWRRALTTTREPQKLAAIHLGLAHLATDALFPALLTRDEGLEHLERLAELDPNLAATSDVQALRERIEAR